MRDDDTLFVSHYDTGRASCALFAPCCGEALGAEHYISGG